MGTKRTEIEIESELVDLSDLSLADLADLDPHQIHSGLARVLQRIDDVDGRFSAYNPSRTD
jgi:hypothetical protein